jgi:hypothetical protein
MVPAKSSSPGTGVARARSCSPVRRAQLANAKLWQSNEPVEIQGSRRAVPSVYDLGIARSRVIRAMIPVALPVTHYSPQSTCLTRSRPASESETLSSPWVLGAQLSPALNQSESARWIVSIPWHGGGPALPPITTHALTNAARARSICVCLPVRPCARRRTCRGAGGHGLIPNATAWAGWCRREGEEAPFVIRGQADHDVVVSPHAGTATRHSTVAAMAAGAGAYPNFILHFLCLFASIRCQLYYARCIMSCCLFGLGKCPCVATSNMYIVIHTKQSR